MHKSILKNWEKNRVSERNKHVFERFKWYKKIEIFHEKINFKIEKKNRVSERNKHVFKRFKWYKKFDFFMKKIKFFSMILYTFYIIFFNGKMHFSMEKIKFSIEKILIFSYILLNFIKSWIKVHFIIYLHICYTCLNNCTFY